MRLLDLAAVYGLAGTAAKAVLVAGLLIGLLLYRSRPLIARAAAAISIVVIVTAPLSFARLVWLPALSETVDFLVKEKGLTPHEAYSLSAIAAERPTVVYGVPTSYAALLAAAEQGIAYDLSSVRVCVSAGEALPSAGALK